MLTKHEIEKARASGGTVEGSVRVTLNEVFKGDEVTLEHMLAELLCPGTELDYVEYYPAHVVGREIEVHVTGRLVDREE